MDANVQPYLILPRNAAEEEFGKPTLLTDCQIAHLLNALRNTESITPEGSEVLTDLWEKMHDLWSQEVYA